MAARVAINGFGRIGRNMLRAGLEQKDYEIVAVNDLTDAATLAHLLEYDSIHGRFPGQVEAGDANISVNGKSINVLSERDPAQLPWGDLGVDVVIESTGLFASRDKAAAHLQAGARKVVISAPAGDVDLTLCYGVNHESYDPASHHVISNASCTTNCLSPVAKVLHQEFTLKRGLMTTIHSYTNDQNLIDNFHRKDRRGRSAALNMVITSTGAATAAAKALPNLAGKLTGSAIRVPTPNVSLAILNLTLANDSGGAESVNSHFRNLAADSGLEAQIGYSDSPELVSSDLVGAHRTGIIDSRATVVAIGIRHTF